MEAIDLGTVFFFATHRSPVIDAVVVAITTVGNFEVMFPLAVLFTVTLARLRDWRTAGLYAGTALLTYFICLGTQHAVGRERPDVLEMVIPKPSQPSFPSGHATNSLVVLGLFGLLATRDAKSARLKWTVRVLLVGVLPLLIGFSRIYLTVHYVSDVLGGWLLATAILFLAYGLDRPTPATGRAERERVQYPLK